jgi:hypothetical protein
MQNARATVSKDVFKMNTDPLLKRLAGKDVIAVLASAQSCMSGTRVEIFRQGEQRKLFILTKHLLTEDKNLLGLGAKEKAAKASSRN